MDEESKFYKLFEKDGLLAKSKVDIPIFVLMGMSFCELFLGATEVTLCALIGAGEGQLLSWKFVVAGFCSIFASVLTIYIGAIYWKYVFSKSGNVVPSLSSLGPILALATILVMFTVMFVQCQFIF